MSGEDSSIGGISADIVIHTTLPAPHEARERIGAAVIVVLNGFAKRYVVDWQDNWTGWQYAGRPATAPRLVSHDAWRATASPTATGAMLTIRNEARDWRKGTRDYVAHVHRSGQTTPEWMRIKARQAEGIDQELVDAVTAAVLEGTGPRTSRVIGDQRGTSGVTLTGPAVVL